MSLDKNFNKILIIDFGSQFTQLIARRVREFGVFSEIVSHTDISNLNHSDLFGIIFSGGPLNVYQNKEIKLNKIIFSLGCPILGICFGHQLISKHYGGKVKSSKINHEHICINIENENLLDVVLFLKNNNETKFKQLIDITAVDYPENERRFKLVYLLLSHEFNSRILIDFYINENEIATSLTSIFPSSNWMEREVFDMYGVKFKNHPDLRRILTDYGFKGHPLRKDFPLTGFNEVRYSEKEKKVIYEPVKLEQNYRNFDFESPWEGTNYIKEIKKSEKYDKKN